jgi:hypothetical protein
VISKSRVPLLRLVVTLLVWIIAEPGPGCPDELRDEGGRLGSRWWGESAGLSADVLRRCAARSAYDRRRPRRTEAHQVRAQLQPPGLQPPAPVMRPRGGARAAERPQGATASAPTPGQLRRCRRRLRRDDRLHERAQPPGR